MRTARISLILGILVLTTNAVTAVVFGQEAKTGSITGRVLLEGKPVQGVVVSARPRLTDRSKIMDQLLKPSASPNATTDSEGKYTIENLPFGAYSVSTESTTYVNTNGSESGLDITVNDSTPVDKVDFSLARTGVITGRISDSEGRPIINEQVYLKPVTGQSKPDTNPALSFFSRLGDRMYFTDDRGIYRIYGLRPGRYIVSAGLSDNSLLDVFARRPKRTTSYYPGVRSEAAATPVDIAPGAEVTGIDLKLLPADKGTTVAGRVIDAESRIPVPNVMVSCTRASDKSATSNDRASDKDEDADLSLMGSMTTTNARGEFKFDSVAPGSYEIEAAAMPNLTGDDGFYADPMSIQVQYDNLDKIEVKVHRGAGVSGMVSIENGEADSREHVPGLMLLGTVTDAQMKPVSQAIARISQDFGFHMSGLKPGKLRIGVSSYGQEGFSVARIERNGSPVESIDVQGNEQIAGLRVILMPTNCVIRGRVTLSGEGSFIGIRITATRTGNSIGYYQRGGDATVDEKGEFQIENLPPGTYEVVAQRGPNSSAKQTVTVSNGAPAFVTLVLDLKTNQ